MGELNRSDARAAGERMKDEQLRATGGRGEKPGNQGQGNAQKEERGRDEEALVLTGRKRNPRAGTDQPLHLAEEKTKSSTDRGLGNSGRPFVTWPSRRFPCGRLKKKGCVCEFRALSVLWARIS